MSREPRHRRVHQCVVGPFKFPFQFRGKGLRDSGHGRFRDTCPIGREKTKETLKAVLVETPARTNAKGVQCELRSESVRVQKPKTRVVELWRDRVVRVIELRE